MIKITKKRLEKNLGYKIRNNVICLGVDTATTTGLALINVKNETVKIEYTHFTLPSIPKKIADQMVKAEKYEQAMDSALQLIRSYKNTLVLKSPSILILEQSFLMFFGRRAINPETYGYLRSLGGVYYSELYDQFDEIKFYLPTVARKLAGFHSMLPKGTKTPEKKKEIMNWISNVIQSKIETDDDADALMLCFAGLKI
jgi:Holliday junction resolvasome RuvABC endonuclease subunit